MTPLGLASVGSTGISVTRLGLGTAPLGGWPSAVAPEVGHDTILAAWESGIRYFDTAPLYGYGQSERWLGEVLRDMPRDTYRLSTKVGKWLVPFDGEPAFFKGDHVMRAVADFTAEGAWRSIEQSLIRLGTDRVDMALIHDPDDHLDDALAGSYRALAEMRDQGIVGAIGAGMNSSTALAYLARRADFDCALLAGRFTLLDQSALDDLLPLAQERSFAVIAGGVFNSGLLAGPGPKAMYDYAAAPEDLVRRARQLERLCEDFGVPLKAAALQFPTRHPAVAAVLTGARTRTEVVENAAFVTLEIPEELWVRLEQNGLVRALA